MHRSFKRRWSTKRPKKVIHIYTEGKKTEVNYFNAIGDDLIRNKGARIQVKGLGLPPYTLIEEILREMNGISRDEDTKEDEWWVVFDKDDHPRFDEAIDLAHKNNIRVAYSIERFELWFMLHFELVESSMPKTIMEKRLSKHLGKAYEKGDKSLYTDLKTKEKNAIANAKRLETRHSEAGTKCPSKRCPSTTVHVLVEHLRGLKG